MQNNSLIRVFGILFALVSIYQLSFTFISSSVETEAENYAIQTTSEDVPDYLEVRDQKAAAYLDSIGNNSLFGFTTYNDAKAKELNKGLDLKGGINVILQISIRDILKGLAENTRSVVFNKALDEANDLQKSSDEPYVESFFKAFEAVKSGEKLSSPDIFGNRTLSDEINFEMSDAETQAVIRRKIDESIVSAFEVLRKRIDKFGVTQPNIQRLGTSGRILVELPGAKDVDRVKNLLQSTAQLEFWETFKNDELIGFLIEANQLVSSQQEQSTGEELEEKDTASEIDDLLADVASTDSITPPTTNLILDKIVLLSNAVLPKEKIKALPISCFLTYVPDSLEGLIDHTAELRWLSVKGGGVGGHWNAIRSVSNIAPGPIKTKRLINLIKKDGLTINKFAKQLPGKKIPEASEIGKFVNFVVQNKIISLNGNTITFDSNLIKGL